MSKQKSPAELLKSHGIQVTRMGSLDSTGHWHLAVRIKSPDGFGPEKIIPFEVLADPRRTVTFLAQNGLRLPADPQVKKKILDVLRDISTEDRCQFTAKLGWHNNEYLLEDRSFGAAGDMPVAYIGVKADSPTSGTLEEWQQHVAEPAQKSTIATLLICAALAPTLQRFTDVENGFFHISGRSGVGKTTMAQLATSVWRGGAGSVDSWNMTTTAIEERMLKRNDGFFCIDEVTVAAGSNKEVRKVMKEVSYKGTGGKTKTRAQSYDGGTSESFRFIGVSTGELSAIEIAIGSGDARLPGEEARLIDLRIPESPTGVYPNKGT